MQTACTKANVKLLYFFYKSLMSKVNCLEVFSKKTSGMVFCLMESDIKTVRINMNQQHLVAILCLYMGGVHHGQRQ